MMSTWQFSVQNAAATVPLPHRVWRCSETTGIQSIIFVIVVCIIVIVLAMFMFVVYVIVIIIIQEEESELLEGSESQNYG